MGPLVRRRPYFTTMCLQSPRTWICSGFCDFTDITEKMWDQVGDQKLWNMLRAYHTPTKANILIKTIRGLYAEHWEEYSHLHVYQHILNSQRYTLLVGEVLSWNRWFFSILHCFLAFLRFNLITALEKKLQKWSRSCLLPDCSMKAWPRV